MASDGPMCGLVIALWLSPNIATLSAGGTKISTLGRRGPPADEEKLPGVDFCRN